MRACGEEGSGDHAPRQGAAAAAVPGGVGEGAEGAAAPGGDDPGSAQGSGAGAAGRSHPRLRRPDLGSGEGLARGEASGYEGEGDRLLLLLLRLQGDDAAGTVQDAVLGAAGVGESEGGAEVLPHRGVLQGGDEVQTGPFPGGTSQGGAQAVPQGGAPVVTPGGGGDDASCAEEEVVGPPGGETCDAVIAYDGAET